MASGHRRPKKNLQFAVLLDVLKDAISQIPDSREPTRIEYSIIDIYKAAFAMFYFQDKSLLEFQRQLEHANRRCNLNTVYEITSVPKDTQLRDVIDAHDYAPLRRVFKDYFSRLQRGKHLESFQTLGGKYLVSLDGSEYFSSHSLECPSCLTKEHRNGSKTYSHQILQAAFVHPDKKQVIPACPEFIHNTDGAQKQDCEINAGKRMIEQLKDDHPRLPMIILGDSLYAKAPFVQLLIALGLSYILTAKQDDHTSLYTVFAALEKGNELSVRRRTEKNKTYTYQWCNGVFLNSSADSPLVNFVQLSITDETGKVTYRCGWVTDLEITEETVEDIVRSGRARWKIENEGFNTLKNQGYHIDHNFGHGKQHLSEALFILNLLAFFFHQIFELSDTAYQMARATCSARTEYWNLIRSAFRLILFNSWEDLLERINSPPQFEDLQKKRLRESGR